MGDPIITPDDKVTPGSEVAKTPSPAHEKYNFDEHSAHHTARYSAIDLYHGKTILILNLPSYADANFNHLHEMVPSAAVSEGDMEWAQSYLIRHPGHPASELAQAMTVAKEESTFGSFPRALSFFDQQTFWSTVALILLALIMMIFARRRDQYKPANRVQNILETLVLFVRDDIVRPNIAHGDHWTPFFASLFLTILTCNLFGIIPFFATATGNLGVTASFAILIFILMLFMGIKENGIGGFWFKIIPVKWSWNPVEMFVYVLLMFLEWISLLTRPAILAIRLFANMLAGHTVLLVFLSLGWIFHESSGSVGMAHGLGVVGWFVALAIYALEVLVAFIQAYIFTLLGALFIGQCAHPEH